MVNKISLEKTGTKGEVRQGVAYVLDFTKKTSSTGKIFITGTLKDKGSLMSFKVWSENIKIFEEAVEETRVINFTGTIDDFGGNISLVLSNAEKYVGPFSAIDFLEGIDETSLLYEFWSIIKRETNDGTVKLMEKLFNEPLVKDRFFKEFAGKIMHDAIPGGLANHTIKMMKIFLTIASYNEFFKQNKDLMLMGIALHDVGKVKELKDGAYEPNAFMSHIYYGVSMIEKYKDEIIKEKGEDFYFRLVSIIVGHHDVYETPAKTVYAKIVHMIDNLEAKSTQIDDSCTDNFTESANGDKTIGKGTDCLYL